MPRRRIVGLGGLKQSPPLHPPRLASTLSSERSSAAKGVMYVAKDIERASGRVLLFSITTSHAQFTGRVMRIEYMLS